MQDVPMGLGDRLRAIREDRTISRETVAGELKCHRTNLAHIEAGRQQPSVEQLRTLSRLYSCTMEQLIEGPLPIAPRRAAKRATDDWDGPEHVTRDMTPGQMSASLDRWEADEVAEVLRRRGVELTAEQRRQLAGKSEAA